MTSVNLMTLAFLAGFGLVCTVWGITLSLMARSVENRLKR